MEPAHAVSEVFGGIFSVIFEMWLRLKLVAFIGAICAIVAVFIWMVVWAFNYSAELAELAFRIWPGIESP